VWATRKKNNQVAHTLSDQFFVQTLKMKTIKILVLFFLTVALITISSSCSYNDSQIRLLSNQDNAETKDFIQKIDISKYEKSGSDFGNPKYSPLRIGKTLEEIDITYDYDFDRLAKTTNSLQGVNRRRVLKYIFHEVTKGAKNNTEKHLKVLSFLQKSSFHNLIQPMYPDKKAVFDPLLLLELSEMRCGQVARLAVDLFSSVGIKGRVVQAKAHVLAELFYDGAWHFFDADLFGGERMIFDKQGRIPSFVELSQNPYAVDALANTNESLVIKYMSELASESDLYPSSYYFNYDSSLSLYYEKTATEEEEVNTIYGWNYYKTIQDKFRKIGHIKDFYRPGVAVLKNIEVLKNSKDNFRINMEWIPSEDKDGDLIGYKVYVSRYSRGWNNAISDNKRKVLKSGSLEDYYSKDHQDWHPEMLDLLYTEPPHEIAIIKTSVETAQINIKQSGFYYITIVPYDAHGESVGRAVYKPSQEIKIQV
jgi:hypothetical protein